MILDIFYTLLNNINWVCWDSVFVVYLIRIDNNKYKHYTCIRI